MNFSVYVHDSELDDKGSVVFLLEIIPKQSNTNTSQLTEGWVTKRSFDDFLLLRKILKQLYFLKVIPQVVSQTKSSQINNSFGVLIPFKRKESSAFLRLQCTNVHLFIQYLLSIRELRQNSFFLEFLKHTHVWFGNYGVSQLLPLKPDNFLFTTCKISFLDKNISPSFSRISTKLESQKLMKSSYIQSSCLQITPDCEKKEENTLGLTINSSSTDVNSTLLSSRANCLLTTLQRFLLTEGKMLKMSSLVFGRHSELCEALCRLNQYNCPSAPISRYIQSALHYMSVYCSIMDPALEEEVDLMQHIQMCESYSTSLKEVLQTYTNLQEELFDQSRSDPVKSMYLYQLGQKLLEEIVEFESVYENDLFKIFRQYALIQLRRATKCLNTWDRIDSTLQDALSLISENQS